LGEGIQVGQKRVADVRVIPQPCVQVIHHRAPGILSSSFHLPPASAAFR
jgi:hypothetical protein